MTYFDVSTVNQIIQTGGFLFIAWLAKNAALKLTEKRSEIKYEKELLKDVLVLRAVVDRYHEYCKNQGGTGFRNKFANEVQENMGVALSRHSWPSSVKRRLEALDEFDEGLRSALEKNPIPDAADF